jgi:hypothetical protein
MRKILLLAALLVACSKAETAKTDSAAMAPAMAAPAPLTAADVAGTWSGMSMAEGSDSVVNRWTVESVSATEGKLTLEGTKEPIAMTHLFDGDSLVATSAPFTNPATPKAPPVTFRSVGRLKDGKLVGTAVTMLVAKPDSIVSRTHWEATRVAPK